MDELPSAVVKADLGGGRIVAIEARNVTPEQPVGIRDILRFEGVTESIEAIADRVAEAFERIKPDKAALEFGVDVSVESGALTGLIAKGAGGATLKVTLEWERDGSADGDG